MRAVLGETIFETPTPDSKTAAAALAYASTFLERWKNDLLIVPAVAPSAVSSVSTKTLRDSAALARRSGAPLLIHLAETQWETDDSMEKRGLTPVGYLASVGFLGPDVIAAHCVHVNAADIAALARSGAG